MKTRPIAMAAALAAAAAGGVVVGQQRGPNEMGLDDRVEMSLVSQPEPTPTTTPEPPESVVLANVEFILYGADGAIKQREVGHNIVLTSGKAVAIKQVVGVGPTPHVQPSPFAYVCIGSDATAEDAGQSGCINEAGLASNARQVDVDLQYAAGQATLDVTFGAGVGYGLVKESAVMNALASGDGLARKTVDITKSATDSLRVIWTLTQG